MPFDGVGSPFGYQEQFDRVIALIEAPNHWVKHSYNTPWGGYCLKEALNIVGVTEIFEPAILKAAEEVMERDFCCIESFNDHPLTQHADVIAVLHRARANMVGGSIQSIHLPSPRASRSATRSMHTKAQWFGAFWRKMFC
jgi:hypothetical protein